ncbi:MAG: ATP-binding protein [bacterium]|nr:ATP-binding protein [bacterium]
MFRRLYDLRSRISAQLTIAIMGAVTLTVISGMVGWYSFDRVADAQRHVSEETVPAIAAAFGIAQHSGALAAAAPKLTSAGTQLDLTYTGFEVQQSRDEFARQLRLLEELGGDDEQFQPIRSQSRDLVSTIVDIENLMWNLFALEASRLRLTDQMAVLSRELNHFLIPAIDDQLFYAMTGYRALDEAPMSRTHTFTDHEILRYRVLSEIHSGTKVAFEILATVFNTSSITLLEPLKERFEAVRRGIQHNLNTLPDGDQRQQLESLFNAMDRLGSGEDSSFDIRQRELKAETELQRILELNQSLALNLVSNVEKLVSEAEGAAIDATEASEDAILTGRNLLIGISLVSVVGAALISWLYIGRGLIRRLSRLSERMRVMAKGDLEEEIEVRGSDEIAEMSSALEVFRQHALEVQRLNLVEKMANELQAKNELIETALTDLEKAQDQIVMREKLAALGELTAGVAHEIRNPLNFIKNFAEGSTELLEEMVEEIEALLADIDENEETKERHALVREITDDLVENTRLIRQHGTRADSIVQSMLMMGRGSGERQPYAINPLVDEHARLAYHSARATDTNFQAELVFELDPEVPEMNIIPQDIGRVFLNLIGNACYAADDRRRKIRDADPSARFDPVIRISTKKLEDGVEISVHDNGSGIPDDVIDKIFNPFFTTKPTDQGTGLGLAMSNDIVRQHGGTITVDSEPDTYTEFTVHLPFDTTPAASEASPAPLG